MLPNVLENIEEYLGIIFHSNRIRGSKEHIQQLKEKQLCKIPLQLTESELKIEEKFCVKVTFDYFFDL